MAQTDTSTSGVRIPSGTEIYDALMGKIEPDLLTASIPLLEKKYSEESTEARAERYKRYEDAYKAYDKAFADWNKKLHELLHTYRRSALASAEAEVKVKEDSTLSNLESQINSLAF